jgi:methylthioribose-1-phosphate isomerase
MVRADDGLGFLLRYENVAHYRDGEVFILDRRSYPAEEAFVRCQNYRAVAQAIADMVTQSGGPWLAAALGMVSAARSVKGLLPVRAKAELERAAEVLANARPTTAPRQRAHIQRILTAAEEALARGADVEQVTYDYVMDLLDRRYQQSRSLANYAVSLFPEEGAILTQCFAETLIGFTLLVAKEQGKRLSLIVPETRPYLQGARLTASVACDQGVPVTVVTDNMPAYLMSSAALGRIAAFISAADVITLDGHVVNKIGTFQIAIAAHYHGIPYYVLGAPSATNPGVDSVEIEQRDAEETLHAMGVRTAKQGVQGFYPAFDITPPHLVSAVVTSEGIYSPYDLKAHFGPRKVSDE